MVNRKRSKCLLLLRFRGLNEFLYIMHLKQCLAPRKSCMDINEDHYYDFYYFILKMSKQSKYPTQGHTGRE